MIMIFFSKRYSSLIFQDFSTGPVSNERMNFAQNYRLRIDNFCPGARAETSKFEYLIFIFLKLYRKTKNVANLKQSLRYLKKRCKFEAGLRYKYLKKKNQNFFQRKYQILQEAFPVNVFLNTTKLIMIFIFFYFSQTISNNLRKSLP